MFATVWSWQPNVNTNFRCDPLPQCSCSFQVQGYNWPRVYHGFCSRIYGFIDLLDTSCTSCLSESRYMCHFVSVLNEAYCGAHACGVCFCVKGTRDFPLDYWGLRPCLLQLLTWLYVSDYRYFCYTERWKSFNPHFSIETIIFQLQTLSSKMASTLCQN